MWTPPRFIFQSAVIGDRPNLKRIHGVLHGNFEAGEDAPDLCCPRSMR